MTTDLLPNTRALIARSPFQSELTAFASWLIAERYTPLAVHRHSTRVDAALPRLAPVNESRAYAASDLNAAFALGHGSRSTSTVFRRRAASTRASCGSTAGCLSRRPTIALQAFAVTTISTSLSFVDCRRRHGHITRTPLLTFCSRCRVPRSKRAHARRRGSICRAPRSRTLAPLDAACGRARTLVSTILLRPRSAHLASRREHRYAAHLSRRTAAARAGVVSGAGAACSIDRGSKSGWRDYGILHLIAYYGLRPSESLSLRLDSIDWGADTTSEQHKTHSDLSCRSRQRRRGAPPISPSSATAGPNSSRALLAGALPYRSRSYRLATFSRSSAAGKDRSDPT